MIFLLLLLLSLPISAMQPLTCFTNENVRVLHDGRRVFVEDEVGSHKIENYQMNPFMRTLIARGSLREFTDTQGYIRVTKEKNIGHCKAMKYAVVAKFYEQVINLEKEKA